MSETIQKKMKLKKKKKLHKNLISLFQNSVATSLTPEAQAVLCALYIYYPPLLFLIFLFFF